MAMGWAATVRRLEAMSRCAEMTRWAGTARDGLVTLTRREDDKICSHDLGSAIIILVMSTRWEAAMRWAAMSSQMGMDDNKGTEDKMGLNDKKDGDRCC